MSLRVLKLTTTLFEKLMVTIENFPISTSETKPQPQPDIIDVNYISGGGSGGSGWSGWSGRVGNTGDIGNSGWSGWSGTSGTGDSGWSGWSGPSGISPVVPPFSGAGLNSTLLGSLAAAGGDYASAFGYSANGQSNNSIAIGNTAVAAGINSIAIGSGSTIQTGISSIALLGALVDTDGSICANAMSLLPRSSAMNSNWYSGVGQQSVIMSPSIDMSQGPITNGNGAWTVAVGGSMVTVVTDQPHGLVNGQMCHCDANWTDNAFMAGLTTAATVIDAYTFTFGDGAPLPQVPTTETNIAATITPQDYIWNMNGSYCVFYPTECFAIVSVFGGTVNTQPTIQFGINNNDGAYHAATITTGLNAPNGRERITSLLTSGGSSSLSAGITVPGNAAGSCSIRFGFIGTYVRGE